MIFTDEDKREANFFIGINRSDIDDHIILTYKKLKALYSAVDFGKLTMFKAIAEDRRGACTPLKMTIIGELGVEREVTINYDGSVNISWISKDIDEIYETGEWAKFDGKSLLYVENLVKINSNNSNNPLRLASVAYHFDGIKISEPKIVNYTMNTNCNDKEGQK